jgi:hypothetical protein
MMIHHFDPHNPNQQQRRKKNQTNLNQSNRLTNIPSQTALDGTH